MPKLDVLLHGYRMNTQQGIVGFCSIILIEGQKRTLVDVGHVGRRVVLQEALDKRGLSPADIDLLVMSHAHWDHNQNFDLFEHAPLLMHSWERKYARRPHRNDWSTPKWTGAMIESHPSIQEVEEGFEIEPGVRVLHTPGHSAGSICILVETDQGKCVLTSDVLLFANQALSRTHPVVFWNREQAIRSLDRVVEEADIIYPGHDQPFRLVNGEVEYVEQMKLNITGVAQDEPGLEFTTVAPSYYVMPGIEEQTPESLGVL